MMQKQKIIKTAITTNIIDKELTAIGIIDFDSLQQTIADTYAAFPDNFHHTFAVKANALVEVLKHVRKSGMGAEVASPGELKIALAAGYIAEEIIYDSPAKTWDDLRFCIRTGISINIDNLQELERLDQLIEEYPETKSVIGFRINPQIGSGAISSTSTATVTSKFGYALADENNRQLIIDIYKQRPWLKSLHTHSGSQGCSLSLMSEGIKIITVLAEQINATIGHQQVVRLDIGGGLPVNFSSDEFTPTFQDYADKLKLDIPLLFSGKYQVKTEFGRAIIAKNGFIVTRVEYTKTTGGRHIATTHAGAQLLTRTAYAPTSWPLRVTGFTSDGIMKSAITDNTVATDIAGPCCFAGDLVCRNQNIPELEPNDYVLIHDTGGYYFSNHFDYNCLPRITIFGAYELNNEVNLKCIRKEDTLEDVLDSMSFQQSKL